MLRLAATCRVKADDQRYDLWSRSTSFAFPSLWLVYADWYDGVFVRVSGTDAWYFIRRIHFLIQCDSHPVYMDKAAITSGGDSGKALLLWRLVGTRILVFKPVASYPMPLILKWPVGLCLLLVNVVSKWLKTCNNAVATHPNDLAARSCPPILHASGYSQRNITFGRFSFVAADRICSNLSLFSYPWLPDSLRACLS